MDLFVVEMQRRGILLAGSNAGSAAESSKKVIEIDFTAEERPRAAKTHVSHPVASKAITIFFKVECSNPEAWKSQWG
jgi:hypothetical protein